VLPFAAPGQERGNLCYALDADAAVRPSELADLADTIETLVAAPGRLRKMAARARHASHPDSAAAVADCMFGHQEVRRVA
jgi:UDP-N-acetylglucosamine:LPS N-acetylglucosamine transferase